MIKTTLAIAMLVGGIYTGLAQDLQQQIQFLEENTGTVQGKKKSYDQQFSKSTDHPYIISVKITDPNKGNEVLRTVNAQDLNPSRVVFEPKRDMVEISAKVKADKKLVKIVEDGETQNYDNDFMFYASEIEEARALTDALKSVIDLAEKQSEKSDVTQSKVQLLEYLNQSTEEVEINGEITKQTFHFDAENSNLITIDVENLAKNLTESYTVNATDLYVSKIDFFTRRTEVLVELKTKADAKLISYVKNGEIGNYSNGFEVLMPSIEHARSYAANMKELVKLAEGEETTVYDDFSLNQCQELLKERIGQVVINQDTYKQSFGVSPENPYILKITTHDVSKGDNLTFSVNAAYLQKGKTAFDTKGNAVLVTLETDGQRNLISTMVGDEVSKYTNSIVVRAQDIETGRELAAIFSRYKQLSREQMEKQSTFSGVDQATDYIRESIGELVISTDTYQQAIKIDPENSCLYTYEHTDVSKDVQYDYEFNFQDIDYNKIQFDTKGVQVLVSLEVRGKNKLIKTYKDGEVDKYVYGFEVLTEDIEQANLLVEALKLKAESCAK